MKFSEILRLVFINLVQNKFKVILTSIGIVVGAATIVMVIAIGRGGEMDVADQFKNLNAGAIDISYTMSQNNRNQPGAQQGGQFPGGTSSGTSSGTASTTQRTTTATTATRTAASSGSSAIQALGYSSSDNASIQQLSAGASGGQQGGFTPPAGFNPAQMQGGQFPGGFVMPNQNSADNRINFERIILSEKEVDDIETFVPDVAVATISFTTRTTVEGGDLESATTYTIAGVKSAYSRMSNLILSAGSFITDANEKDSAKVCVLGASIAKEIFGSAAEAYDSIIYIDSRPYVVNGVLSPMGSVSSGISPDTAIFLPFNTVKKYLSGSNISPTITVIADEVDKVSEVIDNVKQVLAESYPNASFTITDAGTKMQAAAASKRTLTYLLFAMATIVFIVGGIGIMNVLFVSVKERTKEIGILKSIGCRKRDILMEFMLEASFISLLGGLLGVGVSFLITPIIQMLSVRVELSAIGAFLALGFAIITGTAFGFYPALRASRLIPVLALNEL